MSDETPKATIPVRNATGDPPSVRDGGTPGRDILVAGRARWGLIEVAGSTVRHVTLYPGQTALVERTPDPMPAGLEVVTAKTRSKRGK